MCAIIVAASKLKVTDVTGYDPLSEDAQDICGEQMKALQEEINATKDEHSNGADSMFPFGLQWFYSAHGCDVNQKRQHRQSTDYLNARQD
jgi:hypothetical protein